MDGGSTWILRTPASTNPNETKTFVVIDGLVNGRQYAVAARAVTTWGGVDHPGPVATAFVIPGIPSSPVVSDVSPGNGSLSLHFSPGADNGSAITNYEYSLDRGLTWIARTPASTTSPLVVGGLINGTTYQVRLRAVNAAGGGYTALDSNGIAEFTRVVFGAPSAPTFGGYSVGDGRFSANFSPGADNGSAITNYEYSLNDGLTWIARTPASTTSPLVVGGLINGTTYQVRLRAVNAAGGGSASAAIGVRPLSAPSAPTIDSVLPGNQHFSVNFSPGANNGSAIIRYQLEYAVGNSSTWTIHTAPFTTSPVVVSGLINGTTYKVRLRAVNAVGMGPVSSIASVRPLSAPSAPTFGGYSVGDGLFSANFSPGADNGSAITNYEYSLNDGLTWIARTPASTTSPLVVGGLINGTTYQVRLRAVNAAGGGSASAAIGVRPLSAPSAPTIDSVLPGNQHFSVNFSPGANNGSAITNYEYSLNDGLTWIARTPASTTSPLVVGGLINGTTYQVRLRAVNAAGAGSASAAIGVRARQGDVTVSGFAVVGERLTASVDAAHPNSSFTYQWFRRDLAIPRATASHYTVQLADVGMQLSVRVTELVPAGTPASGSASTSAVQSGFSFTSASLPTITGSAVLGQTLSASLGEWTPAPTTVAYQWLLNGAVIRGATGSTYTLTSAAVGRQVSVRVTGSKVSFLSATRESTRTSTVLAGFPFDVSPVPTISGSAVVGQTLSASLGEWTPAPTTVAYQWLVNGLLFVGRRGRPMLWDQRMWGVRFLFV